MIIRKLFRYENAHIVRKAYSTRCSKNIHGHSYKVEFFFRSSELDESGMVMDFSLIKKHIADFVDSFDHTLTLWNIAEERETIKFACKNFERVVVLPFNSTAEMQAKMFYDISSDLVKGVSVEKVIVHETDTGYGEYKPLEEENMPSTEYPIKIFTQDQADNILEFSETDKDSIRISKGISEERKNKERVDTYNSNFTL